MGWIKRNLFFVVGGILALGLLGGAGFFIYTGWARNSEKSDKLNEIYGKLQEISVSPQQPGNQKINNIQIAREQEKQLREWINRAAGYFRPIPPIPPGCVASNTLTSKTYATALGNTVYQLQQEAKDYSVNLPPQYYFSFQVQSSKLAISQASLDPLAVQLGEVKAITEILYAARVNDLDSIQRIRVSEDDLQGLQSDYFEGHPVTNDLAILTPYLITFRTFSPELARTISGFATSPYPFIVKSVSVQPAGSASMTAMPGDVNAYGAGGPMMGRPYPGGLMPGAMPGAMPETPPAQQPVTGKGGLQTVLKEQLLRITLEVDIVKLLPKS